MEDNGNNRVFTVILTAPVNMFQIESAHDDG